MYKCMNNVAPAYLCNSFDPRRPNCYFRNAKKKLMLPKQGTDHLKRSFSYSGALLWNNLPEEIRTSNSLGLFKRSSHRWFSDPGNEVVLPHDKYVKQFLRIFN